MNAFFKTPIAQPAAVLISMAQNAPDMRMSRRSALRTAMGAAAVVASVGATSGCGFALRAAPKFSFGSVYLTNQVSSPIARSLQRELATAGLQVATGAPPAGTANAVVLNVVTDQFERAAVGQTANGEVRELQLRYRFRFSLSTPTGRRLINEEEMVLERDISFSETDALAKAAELELMSGDMQGDLVQQVMRRLAAVKPV